MVVEYLDVGRARPFVRGVFVADDEIDELLRQTEPKAHDSWETRLDEPGSDPLAPQVADAVLRRVRDHVRRLRDQLKPASRPAEDVRLPELERLFGRIFSGSGGRPPGPEVSDRPFTINVEQQVLPVENSRIKLEGASTFALSDHHDQDSATVDVLISYRFVEDGGNGEEAALVVEPASGFSVVAEQPYRFRGQLTREPARFRFDSAPYQPDWTGRIKADVEFVLAEERP